MNKKRILVVDDESGFTSVMKIILEATGDYQVLVQNSASEAVSTALEFRPHIILLDVIMPGKDGADVKREIRASPDLRDVPIIFVTATVSNEDPSPDQPGCEANIMLPKPVTTEKLIRCIEKCLAGRAGACPPQ